MLLHMWMTHKQKTLMRTWRDWSKLECLFILWSKIHIFISSFVDLLYQILLVTFHVLPNCEYLARSVMKNIVFTHFTKLVIDSNRILRFYTRSQWYISQFIVSQFFWTVTMHVVCYFCISYIFSGVNVAVLLFVHIYAGVSYADLYGYAPDRLILCDKKWRQMY